MNKKLFIGLCIIALSCSGIFIFCENTEDIEEEEYLYLYGEECSIIDTTADPDTLMTLPDSVCGDTVIVDTSGSKGDIWKVKLKDLAPFMEALLAPDVIDMLSSMEFQMERQVPPGGNTIVGTWEEEVPSTPPFMPENLLIRITIEDVDSTFLLEVIEINNAKHIYLHNGSWEITENVTGSYIIY